MRPQQLPLGNEPIREQGEQQRELDHEHDQLGTGPRADHSRPGEHDPGKQGEHGGRQDGAVKPARQRGRVPSSKPIRRTAQGIQYSSQS